MTHEDLVTYLVANGWKNYPTLPKIPPETIKELWAKPNEGTPQITLDFTQMRIHGILTDFVEVSLVGELDGCWHDLKIYGLSIEKFIAEEQKIIDSLTKSWKALL